MKVLIVDDSKLLRDRLRESMLTIKNLEIVGEAADGIEALQMIKDKNSDFVILDIRMPEMNGLDVLKKMKETGSKSSVCVFTNHPYPQYKQRCIDLGADYFFDKNNDFKEVITLVDKLSNNNIEYLADNKLANHREEIIKNY